MACHTNCSCPSCESKCGCSHEHSTKCSFYYGDNLPCIDVVYGDDLETILTNINTAVCELTPSGSTYSFSSCDTNIAVTSVTTGTNTEVEVCLDSDLVTEITNNTSAISTINACLTNTIADILSDTITITEESSDSCGRTLRLEFTPSGSIVYDGIIYNNKTAVGTTGGVGNKTLKSFDYDYFSNNNITENDEIRFKATGQIFGDGSDVDTVKLEIYDSNSSTLLYGESFGGFDKVNKQSWVLNGELTVGTGDEALLSLNFLANSKQNGTKATPNSASQVVVNYDITGIDWTGLEIRIVYVHDSTSGATFNFARQLLVEVRKYIG